MALAASAAFSHAKELTGNHAPATTPCPTVEEAIKKMTVPEGYEVRIFASEPMVVNPVAMAWDHRGRLWVVEAYEYPLGSKHPNEYSKLATDEEWHPVVAVGADSPRDRVVILEDTDNDGVADKRTVFVEGLNLATGILCGHGGVFIGQAPNLFFFRDKDGDDKADEYKAVLTGFGLEDRHELLNSFMWGPDGGLYFTHGVFTNSKVHRPTEPKEKGNTLNAGLYRVRITDDKGPTAFEHEVYADGTSNPWGCDYDAAGNWFVEACVIDHLFHLAPGGIYQRQGGAPENPYAYELLPSIVNHKHFRAAYAGFQIYQGGRYPADTDGHLFFGNIHDNSIHEEKVEPAGATFKASPVRDFLRANDGWFRPVSIQTGPDGFLWVMDWCDKYPCYQNAMANPEGVDREKGRIWRIVHHDAKDGAAPLGSRPTKDMDLSKLTTKDLIERLYDKNSWQQRHALQILLEKNDVKLPSDIFARAKKEGPVATRRALATLAAEKTGYDPEDPDLNPKLPKFISELAKSKQPAMRALSAEIFARHIAGTTDHGSGPMIQLAGDEEPMVRLAVAVSLRKCGALPLTIDRLEFSGEAGDEGWRKAMTALLRASKSADRQLAFSIWMALEPWLSEQPDIWLPWLAKLAPDTKPLSETLTYKAARRITDTRDSENMDMLLAFLDKIKADDALVARALEGMLKAQQAGAVLPKETDASPFFEFWAKSANNTVRDQAARLATLWGNVQAENMQMALALDHNREDDKRIAAIQTVRKLKHQKARETILTLLGVTNSDALSIEVLRAAGEMGGKDFANLIIARWNSATPVVKSAAAEVMISRADWAVKLLDAVEAKQIPANNIPATARRYFAMNSALKARATQLLGTWNEPNADIKALIAAKRAIVLAGEPDLAKGKQLFAATCATCHKFLGNGQEVGPDLTGSGRSNLDALLVNVIAPDQIIGNGYENTIVQTKDQRTLSGRVVEDTPTQVTLLGIGGRREVVARGDITKMENTHQSVMPTGFGAMADDALRDLLWYVLAPPEEGKLTPSKKAQLAAPVN
jgi:putative membrane-bound dehydrogenase-like protein